ncbi:GSCOCT00014309001.2-RA-CDS [Cotesia congregata]|uniref:Cc_vank.6_26.3b n=3 Tax=root TaxID=1 RepID=S6CWR0_COTCN|nr:GSCOCT00014309001.2-RA-CDS [Cotesia congregata]CAG5094022.1 cc_vank.6_26.3b [Cotesia congregata]CAJ55405.1 putative ankyrin protein 6 [Bracoviriform congregatae]CCQ71374.1 viral ankyrin VANK-6 [Cotesia congregata]
MLSARSYSGGNYFHETCEAGSLALLMRAEEWMDQPISSILTRTNYNGEQCTHILVRNKDIYAQEMMNIVLKLGADINGKEGLGGFTPLHLCVYERNYELAEWLCRAPGINLEATNFAGQTVYQFALERNDIQIMEILRKAGAKCEP